MVKEANPRPTDVELWQIKDEYAKLGGFDRYCIGVNPHTLEVYMVHFEGVTYRVGHDKPWRFNDMNLTSPFFTVFEVLTELRDPDAPRKNLATWIREHNARLESNFYQAHWVLTTDSGSDSYDPEVERVLRELLDGYGVL